MLIRDSRFEIQSTKATNQENASKLWFFFIASEMSFNIISYRTNKTVYM